MKATPLTWALAVVAGVTAWPAYKGTRPPAPAMRAPGRAVLQVFDPARGQAVQPQRMMFTPAGISPISLIRTAHGYDVVVDGRPIGPANLQEVEGFLSLLRTGTVLRAAAEGAGLDPTPVGRFEVEFTNTTWTMEIGDATPDAVGAYARFGDDPHQVWVVEHEWRGILERSPSAWLSRRLVQMPSQAIAGVRGPDFSAQRGDDDLWRGGVVRGPTYVIDTAAMTHIVESLSRTELVFAGDAAGGAHQNPNPQHVASSVVEVVSDASQRETITLGERCQAASGSQGVRAHLESGLSGCVDRAGLMPWVVQAQDSGHGRRCVENAATRGRRVPTPLRSCAGAGARGAKRGVGPPRGHRGLWSPGGTDRCSTRARFSAGTRLCTRHR